MPTGVKITDLQAHFDSKLIVGHEGGHWSLATKKLKGYHRISVGGGRQEYAHRTSYELHVGPIPEGLDVDHKCTIKWCCNPAHLEAVTHAENIRRRDLYCGRDEQGRYRGKR